MTSIRSKLTLGAALLFAGGLAVLLAANAAFMEPYFAARTRVDFQAIRTRLEAAPPDPASQLDAARALAMGTGYRIVVSDRDGIVQVSSVPEFQEGERFPLPRDQLEFFLERRERLSRGESFFGILDSSPRGQSVIQLVAGLPRDRYLVITQPLEQLRRSIAAASPFFLLVGGLVLVLQYALVLALSSRAVRPIIDLSRVAGRVASGDLSARYAHSRRDELGALGDSLNAMAARLAENIADLTAANEELGRKVMAQEAFIAGASHELKTPVGLMRGYAEAIKLGLYASEAERDELADVILKESDHLDRLVRDLAQLAALEGAGRSLLPADGDLGELASRAAARFSLAARERSLELRLEVEGPLPARFDPDRATQILDNLLSNAARHAPEGGIVSVRVAREGTDARIEVENSGEPIPEEQMRSLFAPFYRTDASRSRKLGGTGLGLALVRAIAQAHGGECGVRNVPGGVAFWVRLPVAGPP